MRRTLKAYIETSFFEGTRIHIAALEGDKMVAIAQPLVMQSVGEDSHGVNHPPCITLPNRDNSLLQSLVDQAWDMGIRPRFAQETTPEVNAVKYHLEDMRRIVFKEKGKQP